MHRKDVHIRLPHEWTEPALSSAREYNTFPIPSYELITIDLGLLADAMNAIEPISMPLANS